MAYLLALACNTETLYVYFYLEVIYFVFQSEVLAGVLLLCFRLFFFVFNCIWFISFRCCCTQAAFHVSGQDLFVMPSSFHSVYRRGLVQLKHFNFCCHISKLIVSS